MITVYTPTYNRAYCLSKLYASLCIQTQKFEDFEWMVIDDGSTDETEIMVQRWMLEAPFKISYFKQANEGKMAKLNFAHSRINSELCMCVDSDDYLTENAIEIVMNEWDKVKHNDSIAGLVALDMFENGNLVGTAFPYNINKIKYCHFESYGVKGDKKFIYKTSIIKKYPPYPSIAGERFPAPGYLYRLIDVDYDLSIINHPICIVEYLPDGLSKNKYKQFKNAPNAFMFYRQERMRLAKDFPEKFKNAVHYVSSALFAKKNYLKNNNFPLVTLAASPLGLLLYFYIKKTNKKGVLE